MGHIRIGYLLFIMALTNCHNQEWRPISSEEIINSQDNRGQESKEPEDFSQRIIIDDCLNTLVEGTNACVFGKNPVADTGAELKKPPVINLGSFLKDVSVELQGLTDMSEFQTQAVQIPGESLQNDNFVIETYEISKNGNGDWKYPFQGESYRSLVNVHTFFWLNHLAWRVKDSVGTFYAKDQKIEVMPFIPLTEIDGDIQLLINAFWAGAERNLLAFGISQPIGLDKNENPVYTPLGLDTGIIAHEVGHAILDYSSAAPIKFNPKLEVNDCGPNEKTRCSKFVTGSPGAIHEGVGDIMSFFLFPDSTTIGELFQNNAEGLSHCELPRDVQLIKSLGLKAQDLFEACSFAMGEIHALGSVYSTIWYGVFQRALNRGGAEKRERAYQLFFEHLKNVTTQDTFITLKQTVQTIDQNLFGGQFSEDWNEEYDLLGYE